MVESQQGPSRIFICYRREDTSGYAGRLYDRLRTHFGSHDVFIDIDDIEPGADYVELIDRMARSVDTLIVLIGPRWLLARDRAGNRRIDDSDDFVRLEISAALDRGVRVVPVLVQGAVMPEPAELPPALAPLARRNAIELSDARWDYDAERLIRAIESGLMVGGVSRHVGAVPPGPADAVVPEEVRSAGESSAPGAERDDGALFAAVSRAPAWMAVAGASVVFVWGVLVGRSWHPEVGGIRIGAAAILVVMAGLGLWRRSWGMVTAAGVAGAVGFGLWLLQLLATGHDVEDLLSPSTDGIPNSLVTIGMLLVLAAGVVGSKRSSPRR
ncbi:MAG TPA: toll/interleukin-1 receptor domain-containing protein [Nitriliruptorales bacterium]|nr:toll/interleukin-1 receptor domain-containing protein [Nitriliruptorales bacterium]